MATIRAYLPLGCFFMCRVLLVSCVCGVSSAGLAQPVLLEMSLRDFRAFGEAADLDAGLPAGFPDMGRPFAGLQTGMVRPQLGPHGVPRLIDAGTLVPLAGCGMAASVRANDVCAQANFAQWFQSSVSSTQERASLAMREVPAGSGTYVFSSSRFVPLNGRGFSADATDGDQNNYHFTAAIRAFFTYQGNEFIRLQADDDGWVFINGALAIDVGGVHVVESASVEVKTFMDSLPLAERCVIGQRCSLRIFFAERGYLKSEFGLVTTIRFDETDADGDGVPAYRDVCPARANVDQRDVDGDDVGDACDTCPTLSNADQNPAVCAGLVPLEDPILLSPASGSTVSERPVIIGTGFSGTRIEVVLDGRAICTVVIDTRGEFRCIPSRPLWHGAYSVVAREVLYNSATGVTQVGEESNRLQFSVTGTAPPSPVLTSPAVGVYVNERRPSYTGFASADAGVRLRVSGSAQPACNAVAAADRTFSCRQTFDLPEGEVTILAVESAPGAVSSESAPFRFFVDVTPPSTPVLLAPAAQERVLPTTDYAGTAESETIVTVRVGGRVACSRVVIDGGFQCRPLAGVVGSGLQPVSVTASDFAGNESMPWVGQVTVDFGDAGEILLDAGVDNRDAGVPSDAGLNGGEVGVDGGSAAQPMPHRLQVGCSCATASTWLGWLVLLVVGRRSRKSLTPSAKA
jgi:fibro-slime domain-containing protein